MRIKTPNQYRNELKNAPDGPGERVMSILVMGYEVCYDQVIEQLESKDIDNMYGGFSEPIKRESQSLAVMTIEQEQASPSTTLVTGMDFDISVLNERDQYKQKLIETTAAMENMQEERDQYKEWWDRAEKNIGILTAQLLVKQATIDAQAGTILRMQK